MNQETKNQTAGAGRALALSRPHADLPTEADWHMIQRMAKAFHESGLYPNIKNAAQAIAVVQTGRERGVPPGVALQSIKIITGVPCLAAELMAGLVQRDHGDNTLRVIKCSNEECVVQYQRRGWDKPGEITFTMDDAERAGLLEKKQEQKGKSNWEKYPRAMLRSRAISEACRTAFQDTILGLYTPEEIAPDLVRVTAEGEMVVDEPAQTGRVVDLHTGEMLEAESSSATEHDKQSTPLAAQEEETQQPEEAANAQQQGTRPAPTDALTPGQASTPNVAQWTREQLAAGVRQLAGTQLGSVQQWAYLAQTYARPVPSKWKDMSAEWLLELYQAMQTRAWEERIRLAATEEEVTEARSHALSDRDKRRISTEQYTRLYDAAERRYAELSGPLTAQAV